MRRLLTIVVAVVSATTLASTARASNELPVVPVMPQAGATYPSGAFGPRESSGLYQMPIEVRAAPGALPTNPSQGAASMSFEISAVPTLGQDGTLADDLLLRPASGLRYRDSDPLAWIGLTALPYLQPGAYYFQLLARVTDSSFDPAVFCPNQTPNMTAYCTLPSPVYQFSVAAPPASGSGPTGTPAPSREPAVVSRDALTAKSAISTVRRFAAREWKARQVRVQCRRIDESAFRCVVRWTRRGKAKRRAVEVYRDRGRNYVQSAN